MVQPSHCIARRVSERRVGRPGGLCGTGRAGGRTTEVGDGDPTCGSGAERAVLYRLAAETGLRAGELRSLTRASFNLDGDEPTVTVAAAYAKNRREAVQPLPPPLVPTLREHLSSKLPAAPAFVMLKANMIARILRADLAAARAAWLKESKTPQEQEKREASNFLTYRDDAGRVADFHAFRHTYISNLIAGGVHPKTAQQLARHGSIGLTMDRYTHVYRGDLATALGVLPDLSTPAVETAKRTGTDDVAAVVSVSPGCHLWAVFVRVRWSLAE